MKGNRVWQCGVCLAASVFGISGASSWAHGEPVLAAAQSTVAASEVIRSAALALGPERARLTAMSLQAEMRGTYYALEQARSPSQPIAPAARIYRWVFDARAARAMREAEQLFPGGIRFSSRAVATAGGLWAIDLLKWRSGTDISSADEEEALKERLQWERFLPHLLIRQAAQAGAGAERTGPGRFRYKDAAGKLVEVTLDPVSGRPVRAVQIEGGQSQMALTYSKYERRHGFFLPTHIQVYRSDRLQEDLTLGRTVIGPAPASHFSLPEGYSPAPAARAPAAREIAPGILFFDNLPGNYHSLAIDAGDHIVLVEAPLSPGYAAQQKRLLEELRPGKPVRFVLVTHHHGDHTGGLITWIEAGATIIVPEGGTVAIERQLRARGFAGPARIEEVRGKRTFGTGLSQVDAYAFASGHSEAHLVAHLPEARLLFQGDLFYIPERGEVPAAFPVVAELQDLIDHLGLKVERILGVHGRPGTPEDIRSSLRKAMAPQRS